VAILLSLITAFGFGAGDYAGGRAARRASVLHVLLGAHAIGLLGVLIAAPFIAESFSLRDFVLGSIGGFFGLVAIGMMYRRLAIGPMVVVAPITAVTSAAVPALWSVARGDSLSRLATSGVVVALVAIVLVSQSRDEDGSGAAEAPVTAAVVGESLLAGACFGVFFIFLDETAEATAPWPLVGGRLTTVSILVLVIAFLRISKYTALKSTVSEQPLQVGAQTAAFPWLLVFLTGVFDGGGNLTFLLATGIGSLSTVAVLSSLYPVVTVALARTIDRETMSTPQIVGLVLALVATVLISIG